jgi:hypothetical protein
MTEVLDAISVMTEALDVISGMTAVLDVISVTIVVLVATSVVRIDSHAVSTVTQMTCRAARSPEEQRKAVRTQLVILTMTGELAHPELQQHLEDSAVTTVNAAPQLLVARRPQRTWRTTGEQVQDRPLDPQPLVTAEDREEKMKTERLAVSVLEGKKRTMDL